MKSIIHLLASKVASKVEKVVLVNECDLARFHSTKNVSEFSQTARQLLVLSSS